jgi:hypothetical protein
MSAWGVRTFGDPCRECGYGWTLPLDDVLALVGAVPARYREVLAGCDGSERHPDLSWSAVAYVCHVADNLRIWAERLAGLARGAEGPVGGYDENELAAARRYPEVFLGGALWSLERAAVDWQTAVVLAAEAEVVLVHPDRGAMPVLDAARTTAHDAHHHAWDLERIVGGRRA